MLDDKRRVFTLATDETADDIIAICSFILDPDDMKITVEAPPPALVARSTSSPAQTEEELGYGFFEPIEQLRAFIAEGAPAAAPDELKPEAETGLSWLPTNGILGRREADRAPTQPGDFVDQGRHRKGRSVDQSGR